MAALLHGISFAHTHHARIQKVLSDGYPTHQLSYNVFFVLFFMGERIQIPLKAGHHRPASETPLNAGLVALRI